VQIGSNERLDHREGSFQVLSLGPRDGEDTMLEVLTLSKDSQELEISQESHLETMFESPLSSLTATSASKKSTQSQNSLGSSSISPRVDDFGPALCPNLHGFENLPEIWTCDTAGCDRSFSHQHKLK
jgi:hypothetical protein